jgi:3'-phosphoadenosine 5'-phosphosulfate sulfotransferase (PAPS reductase)/FAD synthetase
MYVILASYGNDSLALIQWMAEQEDLTGPFYVLFNDTGWAAEGWLDRVLNLELDMWGLGFIPLRTKSIGMKALVRKHKGWPRQGLQFCTEELKIQPTLSLLDELDPLRQAICCTGKRREESFNRRNAPEWVWESLPHGGRTCWSPLVTMLVPERDELIKKLGQQPLPHRSMECFPCINSNRTDLRQLAKDPKRIEDIENFERSLGHTSNDKPRTMFRPYRYMGATGIREIVRWAASERGGFSLDDGTGSDLKSGCEGGYCAS